MSAEARVESLAGTDDVRLAMVELMGAERRLRGRDQQRCKHGELTQAQIRALFALSAEGEATAGELAKAADLTPASVTAMLDHLEPQGIVERRRSDHDRRVVVVTLTEHGRELLAGKRERWRARCAEALDGISDEGLRTAADVMRRMATLLDDL